MGDTETYTAQANRALRREGNRRVATAAEFAAANPILDRGEIGEVTDTGEMRVGDGSTPWASLLGPSGTYAIKGRRATSVYDEFSRYSNGTLSGTATVGGAWSISGAQSPTVTSGKVSSSGTGYFGQVLAAAVTSMACEVIWSGTNTNQAMTLIASTDASLTITNGVHFNFGPGGFTLTARQNGSGFDTMLTGVWREKMAVDGATAYRVGMLIRGATVVVVGPNGELFSAVDPRVKLLAGSLAVWEPNTTSGTVASLTSVVATSESTTGTMAPADVIGNPGLGLTGGPNGQVAGNRNLRSEVLVGIETSTGMPAVTFGATTIYTRLSGAHSVGATSIITEDQIPRNATIQIESGTNTESVTAGNVTATGSGPYTLGLTGTLANSHADGVVVIATTPSVAKTFMYLNTENGNFYLPNLAVLVCQQNLYFTTNLDVALRRDAAGVLASFGAGAGKGAFKAGVVATGSRPTAAAAGQGAQMFDSTLNKPIWSTGSAWVDATGAAV